LPTRAFQIHRKRNHKSRLNCFQKYDKCPIHINIVKFNADRVIIDENPGRKKAISLGLNIIGILGILLIAKKRRFISTIQPLMDDLIVKAGFRVNPKLYLEILKSAQETDENQ
jgi:predicted nucleic acid-binding protein